MKNIILLFFTLTFLNTFVSAQKNNDYKGYEAFYKSFNTYFKYPQQLSKRCIPVYTIMMIKFGKKGNIDSIQFSDSAFPQFVSEVIRIKNNLNFKSIYNDLVDRNRNNDVVLIPIHIDTEQIGGCKSTIIPQDIVDLFKFSGERLTGNYFMYPGIYFKNFVGIPNY